MRKDSDALFNAATQDEILVYRPWTGVEARCRVRIFRRSNCAVVIVSEVPDNPGMSVTNPAEVIATQVVRESGLDPRTTLWIEHYPDRKRPAQHDPVFQETWDLVTFQWDGQEARHPRWRRLEKNEVLEMITCQPVTGWSIKEPPDDWYLEQEYEDRFYYPEDYDVGM